MTGQPVGENKVQKVKNCPGCLTHMEDCRTGYFEMLGCKECGGFWLEDGHLEAIKLIDAQTLSRIQSQYIPVATHPYAEAICTRCQVRLADETWGQDIVVGRCPVCSGTWLPYGALTRLVGEENLRQKDDKAEPPQPDPLLIEKRAFYIGDRVTWTLLVQQLAAIVFYWLFGWLELGGKIGYWETSVGFFAMLALLLLVQFYSRRLRLTIGWRPLSAIFVLFWAVPVPMFASVYDYRHQQLGFGGFIFLLTAVLIGSGYYLARYLRKSSHPYFKRRDRTKRLVLWLVFVTIPALLLGLIITIEGLDHCFVSFFEIKSCPTAVFGVYLALFGLGLGLSLGLNYYLLFSLYDPRGMDVVKNTPAEIYANAMVWGTFLTLVGWLLLFFMLPSPAGSGVRSSSSDSSYGLWGDSKDAGAFLDQITRPEMFSPEALAVREKWAELGLVE